METRKKLYSLLLLCLALSFTTLKAQKHCDCIEKTVTKEFYYSVSNGNKLGISNKFGDVKVKVWDKNKVLVKVEVVANASSESKALKLLNQVSFKDSETNGNIEVKTVYAKGTNINNNNGDKLEVNYQVFMPKFMKLNIDNSFGDIYIPELNTALQIDLKYGELYADHLNNLENNIELKFGGGYIKSLDGGKFNSAYSDLNLDKISNLSFTNSYGDLKIRDLKDVIGKISYSTVKFDKLFNEAKFKVSFSGDFKINELDESLDRLEVDCNYTDFKLQETLKSCDFDITSHFGDVDFGDKSDIKFIKNTKQEKKKGFVSTHYYKGSKGGNNSNRVIIISSSYGDVKLK